MKTNKNTLSFVIVILALFCTLSVSGQLTRSPKKGISSSSAAVTEECPSTYTPPQLPYPVFASRWDEYDEARRLRLSTRGVIVILQGGEPFFKEHHYTTDAKDCLPASFGVLSPIRNQAEYPGVRRYTVRAGSYTVSQVQDSTNVLYSLSCTEDITQDSVIDLAQRRVVLNLQPYETITCKFTNYLRPTSAPVTIGGTITNKSGRAQSKVRVTLVDAQTGNSRTVTTSAFGYYKFDNVSTQRIYTLSASLKGATFEQKQFLLNEDIIIDFKSK